MRKLKSKAMTILVAAILTFSMTASMMLLPTTSAHSTPWNVPTIAYIHVGPNPAGVGQTVTVGFWEDMPPPTASGPYGDRYGGVMIYVTAPDGTKTTLGPFITDDTGGTSTRFTPTELGTYTFYATFPATTLTGYANNPASKSHASTNAYVNDTFMASTSNTVSLTVQQSPVGGVAVAPLPTAYWQTPINAMNVNNWYVLGGASQFVTGYSTSSGAFYNMSGNYNPYSLAPTSAHILWTEPVAFGGALGGQFGGTTTYGNYYSTQQYEHKFEEIVMNGFIYYTEIPGSSTSPTANVCLNLYNGQTVWTDSSTNLGGGNAVQTALTTAGLVTDIYFGQILDYVSPNQYGGLAYIWTEGTLAGISNTGTEYNMFDAMTGKYILSIVNGTGLSQPYFDHGGNLIGWYTNTTVGTLHVMGEINDDIGPAPTPVTNPSGGELLVEWNSTMCIMAGAWSAQASGWEWRPPQNGQIPFEDGIEYAYPIATTYNGNAISLAIKTNDANTIVMSYVSAGPIDDTLGWGVFAGYSAATGQQLWIENITTFPPYALDVNVVTAYGDGVFLMGFKSTYQIMAYSMTTGQLLWTDTLSGLNGATPDAYDSIGGFVGIIAYGNIYDMGYGGDIWSINIHTGAINWYTNTTQYQGPAGTNSPYTIWPIWTFATGNLADGLLIAPEGHEYSPPLFLGAQLLAINCTNGQLVWKIDSFDVDSHPVTVDGILTDLNAYDNQIYAYGQGPSKTTVNAPDVGVTTATPITISGTVMDVSAGASQEAVAADFPNGLPCVSDASMSQFMETAYMQQPMATNLTGVPVTVSVTDANGNTYAIGTTTTDPYTGTYGLQWTPIISGDYTVTATFAGTGGYYGSSATAYFYASTPAPTIAPYPTPVTGLASFASLELGIAAVIIVIVIIGAVLAVLTLRKRP